MARVPARGRPFCYDRDVSASGSDPATVEVWWTSAQTTTRSVDDLMAVLDPDEQRRAERFRVADARWRFVTARAMVRCLLGRRLGVPPQSLIVAIGPRGKPELGNAPNAPRFNLAHSGDVAVVAIARHELGVDVEELRPVPRAERLAARFFSEAERRWLSALPKAHRDRGFLDLWTCKEAYLKAIGTGIELPLSRVEVEPAQPALIGLPGDPGEHARWTLLRAALPMPAICTVAIRGSGWRLEVSEFDWDLRSR